MTSLAHHDRSQIWTCNNNNQASKKYFCDHLSTTLAWEDYFALNLSIVSVKHKSCIMRKVFSINLLVRQCLFLLLSWYIKYIYIYIGRKPPCRINMIIQNLEILKKSRPCHPRLLNIIMANLTVISLPIPDTDWKRSVQEMWRCS